MTVDWFAHRALRTRYVCAVVMLVGLAGSPVAAAQKKRVAESSVPRTTVSDRLALLDAETQRVEQRLEDYKSNTGIVFAIGGSIAGLLTLLLAAGAVRADQRAAASFSLAIEGERDAQRRAGELHKLLLTSHERSETAQTPFLEGSERTLALVNQTLELAAAASDRAARALEQRSKRNLELLDQRAKNLFAHIQTHGDRGFTDEVKVRAEVLSLGDEIRGFEISTDYLLDDFEPTPHCLFFRGMELHLHQHFDDALRRWTRVVNAEDVDSLLRSSAWFWMGYENNNLGQFDEAEKAFANALPSSEGARRLDLRRIRFETQFFDRERHAATDLLNPLEILLEEAQADQSDGIEPVRARIAATLGNVRHQAGVDALAAEDEVLATDHFRGAESLFSVLHDDKWAPFGLAEAAWQIAEIAGDAAERKRAEREYVDEVYPRARDENMRRIEPRTKVLAQTCQLICAIRAPALRSLAETLYENAQLALGQVDERMTVYSQFARRNVPKRVFEDELKKFWAAAAEAGVVKPAHY